MSKRAPRKGKLQLPSSAKQRLEKATEDLSVAERELKLILDALPVALRADKQMVSNALRLSLDKLVTAKDRLASVLEG